jgi:cysteine synthase B
LIAPQASATVGGTPLVWLARIGADLGAEVCGKLEYFNPGGSVKDRIGAAMIGAAEAKGLIERGQSTIVEPTSGNTGIALAMIACAKGYDLELVMPENATAERVQTMRAFGAKVSLTPKDDGMEGAIDFARARVAEGNYVMLDQFSNPDNWAAHERTTGPEIWRDTDQQVTHFVTSMGTTGTAMGVARYFEREAPHVKVVGVHPAEGAQIPGIRAWPKEYEPRIYEKARLHRIIQVGQREAEEMARRLAREEGVFAGVSSGGATWAALRLASELDEGVIVVIICDRGDRYLSSGLFAPEDPRT